MSEIHQKCGQPVELVPDNVFGGSRLVHKETKTVDCPKPSEESL